MSNTIGPPPTGLGWDEDYPALDDVFGNGLLEIRDLRKAFRIRMEKEHTTLGADGAGGEHRAGSALSYSGDYSAAWPTTKPDGETALAAADTGRIAVDTTSSPNRVAIYVHPAWVEIGGLLGDTVIIGNLKLAKLNADPADAADYGFVYTKNVTVGEVTTTELFYIDSVGTVKQLTNGGKLNIVAADITADLIDDTKISLRNAQYLRARNAADNGDVNLISVGRNAANDADVAVLPDKVRTATNASPTEDTQIANKKYVDDYSMKYSGQQVFSDTITTSFVDLNLSAHVGDNRALVILKIHSDTVGSFQFRTNGETLDISPNTASSAYAVGISAIQLVADKMGYISLITDIHGVIERKRTDGNAGTQTITLLSYQRLQ